MLPQYWIFLALVLLLTGGLGYSTYTTARVLRTWKPDRNLLLVPAENGVKVVLILFCIGLGLLSGLPFELLGWHFPKLSQQVLIGTVWGVAIALFFYCTTRWFFNQRNERLYSTVIIDAILPRSAGEAALVAAAMILVVLVEELLFRSLLLGGLQPLFSVPTLLIGTGILFGLLHSPQGWWGIIGASVVGMLFGALFLYYKSLGVPLVAHYFANMVQIGLAMRVYEPDRLSEQPVSSK